VLAQTVTDLHVGGEVANDHGKQVWTVGGQQVPAGLDHPVAGQRAAPPATVLFVPSAPDLGTRPERFPRRELRDRPARQRVGLTFPEAVRRGFRIRRCEEPDELLIRGDDDVVGDDEDTPVDAVRESLGDRRYGGAGPAGHQVRSRRHVCMGRLLRVRDRLVTWQPS
jgi:hypothetical protein